MNIAKRSAPAYRLDPCPAARSVAHMRLAGRDGALRCPGPRSEAAQWIVRTVRRPAFVPPAWKRAGTSQRDVPTARVFEWSIRN
jgi:hypothetical protein